MADTASCLDDLVAWAIGRGAQLHGCAPAPVPNGGRGIVARTAIAPGSPVATVPVRLLLTADGASDDARLASAIRGRNYRGRQVLAMRLLHERSKGASSHYSAYVNALPQHYCCLCAWSPKQAARMGCASAIDRASALRAELHAEWMAVTPALVALGLDPALSTLESYAWAHMTVLSRSVYVPGGGEAGALVPLGDLFNYAPPAGPAPILPAAALSLLPMPWCDEAAMAAMADAAVFGDGAFDAESGW